MGRSGSGLWARRNAPFSRRSLAACLLTIDSVNVEESDPGSTEPITRLLKAEHAGGRACRRSAYYPSNPNSNVT
jgi:hypothetical protein